ncbi:AglZ/HisF2 family acetamidino modification protein [Synechococcus sp. UW105]|uniref:AglZ/HisF2 family acetamidino modification protein n=1 Tax=Synechococcus sp. UW105 TaxID=337067 RepID=UPI000E0E364C|nr:AglZ/HisF2 family acetamidino modification protein [Synechococcus sp. UW105]
MLRTRVIPVLLVREGCLVKTIQFNRFEYVGDPCNTVRIFNELEVDELLVLDITPDRFHRGPDYHLIADLADECFMPLGIGGGVRSLEDARAIFAAGIEKVVINTAAIERPDLIREISTVYGSQAVIVSIDVKRGLFGANTVRTRNGRRRTDLDPVVWAKKAEMFGAGEIMLTSIDREGTWNGFDLELVHSVANALSIPLIAHGGAGNLQDIVNVVKKGGSSAVALGSMVVFQKQGMGVLVNFPDNKLIHGLLK